MQIEPYLIAAVLRGSMAQRLVRRICPDCRKKLKPTRAEAALLRRHGLEVGPVYRGQGCKACHQSGFRGRIGLFELFESSAEVEEMIVSGKRDAEVRSYLASKGLKPIVADGFSKVLQGLTTVSEIERAIAG
jgi:type IV pilus assembly protein PilB